MEEENLQDYINYIRTNNVKKIQINELYYQKDHVDFNIHKAWKKLE